MEFLAAAEIRTRAAELQKYLRIDNLPEWCASITGVPECQGDRGSIQCVWGELRVHRELIRDGVRFTLPGCPHALQWTLTVEAGAPVGRVVVHCTINDAEQPAEFVESIERFVADWRAGLEGGIVRATQPQAKTGECTPWYG